MGVLVKHWIYWRQTNEGGLLSLNHREPYHGSNANDEGDPWIYVRGEFGVSGEHQSNDEHDAENKENHGVCVPEDGEGGELHIMRVGMGALLLLSHAHDVVVRC